MEHISVTGDYKDGCEASLCLSMDVNQRGKVSSLYDLDSKCLVLMVLWTWCESFEVLAGVNIAVLGCDIVWFGRHALKFWKNLPSHVQYRYFSQKYGCLCTKLHIIVSENCNLHSLCVCACTHVNPAVI
jgi:hypothetical protein